MSLTSSTGTESARIPGGISSGSTPAFLSPVNSRSATIGSFSTKLDLVYFPITPEASVNAPGGSESRDQRTVLTAFSSILLPILSSRAATMMSTDCSLAAWTSASRFFNAEYTTIATTNARNKASETKTNGLLIYPPLPGPQPTRRVNVQVTALTRRSRHLAQSDVMES